VCGEIGVGRQQPHDIYTLEYLQGSWLGVLAADLRDYTSTIEIIFFFVHHAVIILVPIMYLSWGMIPIYPMAVFGTWAIQCMQHYGIYLPVSILSGWHIQYMCHPPKQLRVMEHNYRIVMIVGSFGMSWMTQTLAVSLSGNRKRFLGLFDMFSLCVLFSALGVVFVRTPDKTLKNY
jgi:hypothetical protein